MMEASPAVSVDVSGARMNVEGENPGQTFLNRVASGAPAREAAWGGPSGLGRGAFDPTSWKSTLLCWEARALDRFLVPWAAVSAFAVAWTMMAQVVDLRTEQAPASYANAYALVLTTVGFLLVFRLNRAAVRYWDSRARWGKLVEIGRVLVDSAAVHCAHSPSARDAVAAWTLGFAAATKAFLQGAPYVSAGELAGILEPREVQNMSEAAHMPLYAAGALRAVLAAALAPRGEAGIDPGLAVHRATALRRLEQHVDTLVSVMGAMERIRSSPLPLVYISHLRTSLITYLAFMPVVYESSWGWGTIPVVSLTAFVLLGVEGSATECESPFRADRINHLRMSAYCSTLVRDVQQLLRSQPAHEEFAAMLTSGSSLGTRRPSTPASLGGRTGSKPTLSHDGMECGQSTQGDSDDTIMAVCSAQITLQ